MSVGDHSDIMDGWNILIFLIFQNIFVEADNLKSKVNKYYQYGHNSNKIDDHQVYPKYQYKNKVHTEYYFPKNSNLYVDDHYFDTFGNLVVKKAKVMRFIYYKKHLVFVIQTGRF